MQTPKIVIAGINGKMGRASAQAILPANNVELVGAFGRSNAKYVGKDVGELLSIPKTGITITDSFEKAIMVQKPDVLLDLTSAESAMQNAKKAIDTGIRPIIGASGITTEMLDELAKYSKAKNIGSMIVPNFSVGAVLMMEFARQAGEHFSNVEIVEMHHTKKIDAPSGTAMHTARKLESTGTTFNTREVQEKELVPGARGGNYGSGIRVHSLRLPGLISHQEVIFGSQGELLTIRHDSYNTSCFMPGIFMCIQAVMSMNSLTIGLESLLEKNGRIGV